MKREEKNRYIILMADSLSRDGQLDSNRFENLEHILIVTACINPITKSCCCRISIRSFVYSQKVYSLVGVV